MRIDLDIDDTICNTNFVLMKYAFKYNKETTKKDLIKYNTNNFSEVFGWDNDNTYKFFRTYYLEALKEIEPKYNVKEVLKKLRQDGHEIIFITVRNDSECGNLNAAYNITLEWLNKYEIEFDELHVAIKDKKQFCIDNNIDIFMDDSIKNCLSVNDAKIKTFIAMNDFNLDFNDNNITKIYSMNEFYNEINKLVK